MITIVGSFEPSVKQIFVLADRVLHRDARATAQRTELVCLTCGDGSAGGGS